MGREQLLDAVEVVVVELHGEGGVLGRMPADIGVVTMNQSSVEKNGCWRQAAIIGRPVWARASLSAAVVASEPLRPNFTISALGMSSTMRSAASSSSRWGRTKLRPSSIELRPPRSLRGGRGRG